MANEFFAEAKPAGMSAFHKSFLVNAEGGNPPLVYFDAPLGANGIADAADYVDVPQGDKLAEDGAPITFRARVWNAALNVWGDYVPDDDISTPTMAQIRAAGQAGLDIYSGAFCLCVREKADTAGQLQVDVRNKDKTARINPAVRFASVRFPTSGAGALLATLAQLNTGLAGKADELPDGEEGQVVGYGANGEIVAVDAGGGTGGSGIDITVSDRIDVAANRDANNANKYNFDLSDALVVFANINTTGAFGGVAAQKSSDGTWVSFTSRIIEITDAGITVSGVSSTISNIYALLKTGSAGGGGGGDVNVIEGGTDPDDANDGEDGDFYSNTTTLALFYKADGKWTQIAGGGGGAAQTDVLMNLYTDANGQGVAGTYAFANNLPIDSDWEDIVAEVADDGETGTPAQLPVVVLAHMRMKWVETANLNGGRTHSYAFGNRFLEYGGSGNTGIYGRIEGTAEEATHITIGFNSGGALYTLDAVRGRGRAGAKGDKGERGGIVLGDRLDVDANKNALDDNQYDVDISDAIFLFCNAGHTDGNGGLIIYAWRTAIGETWKRQTNVFSAVSDSGFTRVSAATGARNVYAVKP